MVYKVSKNPEFILGFQDASDDLGFVTSITYCAKVDADKASDIVDKLNKGVAKFVTAFEANSWELI